MSDLPPLRNLASAPPPSPIGKVIAVSGAQITVGLMELIGSDGNSATVGRFLGIATRATSTVGIITEINEATPAQAPYRGIARLDLMGEIRTGARGVYFQRGVGDYPTIGDGATLLGDAALKQIYVGNETNATAIGVLQQDQRLPAHIDIDALVAKHFAVLGSTGVGKSNGVAVILQRIMDARPNLRLFLIDPHNEYARCFGERAQVMTPRNLRLPFWLFNFEEIVDAFFGGRPGVAEEVEILQEVIPLAKGTYLQYRNGDRSGSVKKKEARSAGFGIDTPVPYRIEDLITLIDERMGKLENRSSRAVYNKLISRIQTFRHHPRYGFMFENANIGGDTMAEVVGHLFRLPSEGRPMTIMQLAGFPAEVVDSVVSVVSRMAFDFGLWSDGSMPLLFVCEEAHRYAPADSKIGFGPTRRALSRIAKEGRKYGVFLGLVTQRPADIDPAILSQCSTLFVMRLANDRDQALIRSAVSDAAANLLAFIPSLGTGEVFAFGAGVAIPTRLMFKELSSDQRPQSEAGVSTQGAGGTTVERGTIAAVIERWRSSSMSQRMISDDEDWAGASAETPPLAPTQGHRFGQSDTLATRDLDSRGSAEGVTSASATRGFDPRASLDAPRPSILRRPLSAEPAAPPPSRWR